jgi:PAS domain S-box-containing protein
VKKEKDFFVKTENPLEKSSQVFINSFNDEFFWFKDNSDSPLFSENITEVTGYNSAELKSLTDIIYKDDRVNYRRLLNDIIDNKKTAFENEFRITRKDDKIKWVKESIKIFYDERGISKRMIGRVIDISEMKEKTNKLQEINNKLKKQNIDKDSFLNLLSHDLRSPFTSILGFTEILLRESSLTESERNEYLNLIYSSSEKLLQLINYLLDWSKLRSGKLVLNRQTISLQSIIYGCVSSLTGAAVRKNIEIKVKADKSLKVRGDERLLNIVVTNLISNAIKFSYRESEVIVKTEKFNNDFAELIVTDNGSGISVSSKNKMFRMDNIFSAAGTSGEKGTGFGLTLSKEIIEKHKGEIWFYSEENKGSEFHITIPSLTNAILIVETDTDKLNLLSSSIGKYFSDYKILKAANAFDALNYSDTMPSVIIMPDELPLMNGIQLLKAMKKDTDNFGMKIIVINELSNEEFKKEYIKYGEVVFLESKSTGEQVIDALKKLLK